MESISTRTPRTRVLHGPSLFMDHGAVVIEFDAFTVDLPTVYRTLEYLRIAVDAEQVAAFASDAEPVGAHHLTAALVRWLDVRSSAGRPVAMSLAASMADGTCRVAASFIDPARAQRMLEGAYAMARAVVTSGEDPASRPVLEAQVQRLCRRSLVRSEIGTEFAMFWARARRLGIPATFLPGLSSLLLLGQGRHGRLLHATSSDRDSWLGVKLATDKVDSNRLVERLGFPFVQHRLVSDEQAALRAAAAIGFPLVVKPVGEGKGAGVFAGLRTLEACAAAYREAARFPGRGVLVERYVEGDDHRLAVFGGELAWAMVRRPPSVLGNGQHSIAELIAAENARRRALPLDRRPLISAITVDAEMLGHLARDDLTPASVPASGRRVVLRGIANLSRGGVYEDVSDRVHPDNRHMAETIAAAFRMDALGLDFITTDISRSWRDTGGAIIEVNKTPAAGTPHYADLVLRRMFPDGKRVRAPYLLFVDEAEGIAFDRWLEARRTQAAVVGVVTARATLVGHQLRGHAGQSLNERMQSLTLDPGVDVLVARMSCEELAREGLLLERVDHAWIPEGLPQALEQLVRRHASRVSVIGALALPVKPSPE